MRFKLSLTDLDVQVDFRNYEGFLRNEAKWLFQDAGITDVLFVPYAYNGSDYVSFIQQVERIFSVLSINITLITDGDPTAMIENAHGIVIGGNDLARLLIGIGSDINFNKLKYKIQSGTPCLGWNAGSVVVSPTYLEQPVIPVREDCIHAIREQINCHYVDSVYNRVIIENFLQNHITIPQAICLRDAPDGSGIRYEDRDDGIIYSPIPGTIPPKVFELIKGLGLVEV
jgi:peptidase E